MSFLSFLSFCLTKITKCDNRNIDRDVTKNASVLCRCQSSHNSYIRSVFVCRCLTCHLRYLFLASSKLTLFLLHLYHYKPKRLKLFFKWRLFLYFSRQKVIHKMLMFKKWIKFAFLQVRIFYDESQNGFMPKLLKGEINELC